MLMCFVVALLASAIGAVSGLGGGILIKPVLDALAGLQAGQVNFLSGCTVLAMSLATLFRRRADLRPSLDTRLAALAAGSAVGGLLGSMLFARLAASLAHGPIRAIQSALLGVLCLVIVLYYTLHPSRGAPPDRPALSGRYVPPVAGLVLGMVSAFLGIGGGPFNIIVLTLCFAMTARQAALASLFIIFVSQSAGLLFTLIRGAPQVDGPTLALMMLGGVVGGTLGGKLGHGLSEQRTRQAFILTVAAIVLVSGYNFATALLG